MGHWGQKWTWTQQPLFTVEDETVSRKQVRFMETLVEHLRMESADDKLTKPESPVTQGVI